MSAPAPPAIEVAQLTRCFGARLAVDGISFDANAGEIVALLGPNGAGKTTTLRMLAGLIAPTSGRGRVAGAPLGTADSGLVRARVGLLTETPGLWDRLTVRMNLTTYARLFGVDDVDRVVARVLGRLGLADRADDLAAELSKGLRQRVAIARALLHEPPVLLLDEPTSGLDPAAARSLRQLILSLAADGAAIIVCTHNLTEAEQLASRIGVVKTRLLAFDTPAGLGVGAGATLEDVYLGLTEEA